MSNTSNLVSLKIVAPVYVHDTSTPQEMTAKHACTMSSARPMLVRMQQWYLHTQTHHHERNERNVSGKQQQQ